MGTSNFFYINELFAYTNDEQDEFHYIQDNIYYDLKEKLNKLKGVRVDIIKEKSVYSLNSYYRHNFMDIEKHINHNIQIGIKVNITGGYYEGFSIDYDIYKEGSDYEKEYYLKGEEYPYKKDIDRILKYIRNTLKDYLTPLNVKGVFSNGETVYEFV